MSRRPTRRDFLQASTAALAGAGLPYFFTADSARAFPFQSPNARPRVGCIGTGDRWKAVGPNALKFGDCVAVCDVDSNHLDEAKGIVKEKQSTKGNAKEPDAYADYRAILDRKDVDVVTIVTPDHWHSKIALEAMRAGKDVYCEKPLTLTIDEGKRIVKTLKETKRVFQVGTQQRSEMNQRFLTAVALVRSGRLGRITHVQCAIGGAPTCDSIPKADPPKGLDWEKWLGQAPLTDFRFRSGGRWGNSRAHYEFRWWYEYSGGKMTDWGAHHVDIAQWAIGADHTGPLTVEGTAKHPVPYKDGHPQDDTKYNAASEFLVTCRFPGDVEFVIRHDTENGILFTGTEGRIFVSRGKLTGKPVEDLATNPLPDDVVPKLYKGKTPGDHMRNFFECLVTREDPISDVYTHHRAMTTCHLANIAIRLGRKLTWDAQTEHIVGDPAADAWLSREQRKGYEVV